MRLNTKKLGRVLIALLVFTVVAILCSGFLVGHFRSHQLFQRLLAGDGDIEIVSLTFEGQGQEFSFDAETLKYLTECFRCASKEGFIPRHDFGYIYRGIVELDGFGFVTVECNVPDSADGLTIGYSSNLDDPTYYWVKLPQPMPPRMPSILALMRRPAHYEVHVAPAGK